MASFIVWKDYYSVGDESIDTQHRQIIDIINDLYGAMQREVDHKLVASLLERLVQYTFNHFQHEERKMLDHQYPNIAEHKAIHDQMRQKTVNLRDNADLVTGRDLLVFLKEWWCNHIQNEDRRYAPFLKSPIEV